MSRERAISRGERYVAGLTAIQIAREDGFRQSGGVAQEIHSLSYLASSHVPPNSDLPAGLTWEQTPKGDWFVWPVGRITRDQVRWALKTLKDAEPAVCECCGHPL